MLGLLGKQFDRLCARHRHPCTSFLVSTQDFRSHRHKCRQNAASTLYFGRTIRRNYPRWKMSSHRTFGNFAIRQRRVSIASLSSTSEQSRLISVLTSCCGVGMMRRRRKEKMNRHSYLFTPTIVCNVNSHHTRQDNPCSSTSVKVAVRPLSLQYMQARTALVRRGN